MGNYRGTRESRRDESAIRSLPPGREGGVVSKFSSARLAGGVRDSVLQLLGTGTEASIALRDLKFVFRAIVRDAWLSKPTGSWWDTRAQANHTPSSRVLVFAAFKGPRARSTRRCGARRRAFRRPREFSKHRNASANAPGIRGGASRPRTRRELGARLAPPSSSAGTPSSIR